MGIKIIYKDRNFIAINKPAGLLIHTTRHQKTKEPTLVDWLLKNFPQVKNVGDSSINPSVVSASAMSTSAMSSVPNGLEQATYERPGIVHRLDKDTSGIMLVPLNQNYFSYLKKLFGEKRIKKTYLAVVKGMVKEKSGRIDKPIGIKSGTTKRSVYSGKMAKEAVTEYKLLKNFKKDGEELSLLEVFPLTGRTHQIRVHLNYIGHPVAGDKLYGGKTAASLAPRQMLHCFSLEFEVESGKIVRLEAEPPADFLDFLPDKSVLYRL